MRVAALHVDFYFENEQNRYPQGEGGLKPMRYLRHAAMNGWQDADAVLAAEVEARKANP
jgi:hypothetical protein